MNRLIEVVQGIKDGLVSEISSCFNQLNKVNQSSNNAIQQQDTHINPPSPTAQTEHTTYSASQQYMATSDTGASSTFLQVEHKQLLRNCIPNRTCTIRLPNGEHVHSTHSGTISLGNNIEIQAYVVPKFK